MDVLVALPGAHANGVLLAGETLLNRTAERCFCLPPPFQLMWYVGYSPAELIRAFSPVPLVVYSILYEVCFPAQNAMGLRPDSKPYHHRFLELNRQTRGPLKRQRLPRSSQPTHEWVNSESKSFAVVEREYNMLSAHLRNTVDKCGPNRELWVTERNLTDDWKRSSASHYAGTAFCVTGTYVKH